ncbi:hypothetical protein [Kutzneria buriramensis]|uniref:Uncharacterized protein n=1 Tax=Kutzneria buriramensis TaxID=1045776 RepID=A0A3E0HA88_9PSEU|nr:hypothetical protein [Kutzneria buriramensis]REH40943.1 hypothetical protein BCF44_11224 [Kutzneria buriramensis]
MRKTLVTATLVAAALAGLASPALADGVTVVDKPDTSNLNNIWTFDPLGVPVIGALQSVSQAVGRLF